ncbi:MAG: ketoacyl-ACP synthase III [Candidatus Pseudobacter hemicellulosilyticus]|uniref:Ketoacyl-ACP synthase III n=1 Tax=Candidatus Pseudobacter hemicellulosilyticus TaxID=3121375 RepID=A0AAJ5WX22_9BACT|nr:MAG: ketoacyl-ACP synthase III [Pseudobacter sp.]
MNRSVITGTGKYIPPVIKSNADFEGGIFFSDYLQPIDQPNKRIIDKFRQITGIHERRYATAEMVTSDLAALAAEEAVRDSGIDPETLDQLIVANNYGDVKANTIQSDSVPSLASRVKHKLGIRNPNCVAYDIMFGCPGWVQGLIQADAFCKAGVAKKCLVIGAETLSRQLDHHDRDSMIFSDGAGAVVLEFREATGDAGILSTASRSDCVEETFFINFGSSYAPDTDPDVRYIKMKGRKVYEYALSHVPKAMKECFDKTGLPITDLKKIFIHQANEKMDEAILKAFYQLYGIKEIPELIMPMSIHWLGNSSVATVPTLYDLVLKGEVEDHSVQAGDVVMFASVGAGMNINAVTYRV